MPVVYQQLRKLASICLRSERPDHTLRATALVHEAYLRLVMPNVAWQDRVHFFAVSARLLRRILVDHAKANRRQKRGGGAETIPLDEAIMIGSQTTRGIVELDLALQRLAEYDQRKSGIIELLCFGGLTYDEAAAALKVSPGHRTPRVDHGQSLAAPRTDPRNLLTSREKWQSLRNPIDGFVLNICSMRPWNYRTVGLHFSMNLAVAMTNCAGRSNLCSIRQDRRWDSCKNL